MRGNCCRGNFKAVWNGPWCCVAFERIWQGKSEIVCVCVETTTPDAKTFWRATIHQNLTTAIFLLFFSLPVSFDP